MSVANGAPLVQMRGITKRYPGVVALDGVDLALQAGQIHALTGENGSGKSTLAKVLSGASTPDEGILEIDGKAVSIDSPAHALELGIVAISQELTLAPTLTVAENVLMGRLPRKRTGFIDWQAARRAAQECLSRLGVVADPAARVGDLSIELQQEVEIARAVSAKSRVLILDEATSSLSEAGATALLTLVEDLAAQGVAILMISHRMPEVYRAEQATVLRDGRLVGVATLRKTSEEELVKMMVGRDLGDLFNKKGIAIGREALSIRNLETVDQRLKPTSLTVRSGEILGVAGLVGSGKAELGLALAGAVPVRGEVRVLGRPVALKSPRSAIAAGICFVPDDRKRLAIFPVRSVMENIAVTWSKSLTRGGMFLDLRRERRMASEMMNRLRIHAPSMGSQITTLSGGNQQKVILGRWLALSPKVLVLSEPTRGIDVGAKQEIYGLVQDLAASGVAVVMISSELPELLGLSDRILVMFQGEIRGEFSSSEADESSIAHVAVAGRPLATSTRSAS